MTTVSTDRIEKSIVLRASRARVWQALSDATQFGQWFGVALDGAFVPGARLAGRVTHPGEHHGLRFDLTVDRVEPERLLSWRAPFPHLPPGGAAPTTLVVFTLEDAPEGTLLTVTESGFGGVPLAHRAAAYRGNDEGWARQMTNIEGYVRGAA
jgi:uncharacterized protein YndB with AHSA1/START domain